MRLLERELQLGALREYVADARAGDGRLVLVCGEAGIGKSSLVDAFLAEVEDARVAWSACDGAFTPSALGPLQDVADQWGGAVRVACAEGVPRDARFAALLSTLREHDGLSVLVIEDLHFADEATLDLVGHLARRLRGVRALVVATYRDDGLAENRALRETLGEASSQRSTRRIALPPLTPTAVEALSTSTGHSAGEVHALTGGNPFFVSEVLRHDGADLPASARDAVLARAARLSPAGREVLDAAALLGERIEPALLHAVTEASTAALDEPVTAGLLVADGSGLRFRHEIARRAVEHEIGPHRAAEVHGQVLAELERSAVADDARLAHHAAGAFDASAAVRYARRAGDRSAALASRREAVVQYRRALRFVPDDQPLVRADLLDELATQLATLDQFGPAAEVLEESVALWRAGGVPLREGDALRRLSVAYYRLCRGAEEHVVLQRALDVLEPLGASRELAWALSRTAAQHMDGSETGKCYEYAHRAQAMAHGLNLPDVASDALNTLACVEYPDGRWYDWIREALDLAVEHGFSDQTGRGYANLQAMLVDAMRYAEAEHFFREGMVYCDEHDNHTSGLCLAGGQAQLLMTTGRWAEVEEIAAGRSAVTGPRRSTGSPSSCRSDWRAPDEGTRGCGSAWTRRPRPPTRPASRPTPPSAAPRGPRPDGWPENRTRPCASWSWPRATQRTASRSDPASRSSVGASPASSDPRWPTCRRPTPRSSRATSARPPGSGTSSVARTTPPWRCWARATSRTSATRSRGSMPSARSRRRRWPAATCVRPAHAPYRWDLDPPLGNIPVGSPPVSRRCSTCW